MRDPTFNDFKKIFTAIKNYFEIFPRQVDTKKSIDSYDNDEDLELDRMALETAKYFDCPNDYSHRPQRFVQLLRLANKYGIDHKFNVPKLTVDQQLLVQTSLVKYIQDDVENNVEFVRLRPSDQAKIMYYLRTNDKFMELLRQHSDKFPNYLFKVAMADAGAARTVLSCRLGNVIDIKQLAQVVVKHCDNLSDFSGRLTPKNLQTYIQAMDEVLNKTGRHIFNLVLDEDTKPIMCKKQRFKAYVDLLEIENQPNMPNSRK